MGIIKILIVLRMKIRPWYFCAGIGPLQLGVVLVSNLVKFRNSRNIQKKRLESFIGCLHLDSVELVCSNVPVPTV